MISIDTLLALARALDAEGVDYAVFGAVALGLHGLVRATEDLDLFVCADHENIERLKRSLRTVWNDPEIDRISAHELCGEYPALRYGPPEDSVFVDVVTRLGNAFTWNDLEVETMDIEGVPIRVVSPATLWRMKRGTIRPKDHADARAIRDAYDLSDD